MYGSPHTVCDITTRDSPTKQGCPAYAADVAYWQPWQLKPGQRLAQRTMHPHACRSAFMARP
mgnify:CR=1 FL=1